MIQGFPEGGNYKVMVQCCTYNQSRYIEDTLNGFVMQQTDFPFVCCVFDDASTDGEQVVLRQWIQNHCILEEVEEYDHPLTSILMAPDKDNPNCIYAIHLQKINTFGKPEKLEMFAHWEEKCEYVALCEGDDYWIDPLKLQKQVDLLEAKPEYGMCYTKTQHYIQCKNRSGKTYGGPYCEFQHLIKSNSIPTLTVLMNRELMCRYINEVKPHTRGWKMGDYPMWLWFSYNSKIKFIDEVSGVYRILQDSASHSRKVENFIEFMQSGIDIKAFYKFLYTTEYTSRQYFTDLWLVKLRSYAIYNERLKFMHTWKEGIKQDIWRIFAIKPCMYTVYFFCAKLRNDKL